MSKARLLTFFNKVKGRAFDISESFNKVKGRAFDISESLASVFGICGGDDENRHFVEADENTSQNSDKFSVRGEPEY